MTIRPGHSGERKRVPRRAQRNSFQLSLERLEERVLLSLDTQDDWISSEEPDLSADQDSVWVTGSTSLSESATADSEEANFEGALAENSKRPTSQRLVLDTDEADGIADDGPVTVGRIDATTSQKLDPLQRREPAIIDAILESLDQTFRELEAGFTTEEPLAESADSSQRPDENDAAFAEFDEFDGQADMPFLAEVTAAVESHSATNNDASDALSRSAQRVNSTNAVADFSWPTVSDSAQVLEQSTEHLTTDQTVEMRQLNFSLVGRSADPIRGPPNGASDDNHFVFTDFLNSGPSVPGDADSSAPHQLVVIDPLLDDVSVPVSDLTAAGTTATYQPALRPEPLEPRPFVFDADEAFDLMLNLIGQGAATSLELLDRESKVVASQALAVTSTVQIFGSDQDDRLRLDVDASFNLPVHFDGGGGSDTLVGPDVERTWTIDGADAGTVGSATFTGVENLSGGVDNEDTFVFEAGASLSGRLEGGDGGFD